MDDRCISRLQEYRLTLLNRNDVAGAKVVAHCIVTCQTSELYRRRTDNEDKKCPFSECPENKTDD